MIGIVAEPESIIRLAHNYLETLTPEKTEDTSYQFNLEDITESLRLSGISKLASAFAGIIHHYGLDAANELYNLASRTFLHSKGRLWSIWLELFTGTIEIDFPLTKYLDEDEHEKFTEIVNHQLSTMKEKEIKLAEDLPEHFSKGKLVYIENAIERNCAIRIWQKIDTSFENESKEKIYQWGFDNVNYLTTEEEWSAMKSDCFLASVGITEH